MTREEAIKVIENRDSIYCERVQLKEALDMAIEALSAESCEDAISRRALQEWMQDKTFGDIVVASEHNFDCLPPVTPKPKMGHWVKISPAGIYECSECGQNVMTGDIDAYRHCHGCGAKMAESEEIA